MKSLSLEHRKVLLTNQGELDDFKNHELSLLMVLI